MIQLFYLLQAQLFAVAFRRRTLKSIYYNSDMVRYLIIVMVVMQTLAMLSQYYLVKDDGDLVVGPLHSLAIVATIFLYSFVLYKIVHYLVRLLSRKVEEHDSGVSGVNKHSYIRIFRNLKNVIPVKLTLYINESLVVIAQNITTQLMNNQVGSGGYSLLLSITQLVFAVMHIAIYFYIAFEGEEEEESKKDNL